MSRILLSPSQFNGIMLHMEISKRSVDDNCKKVQISQRSQKIEASVTLAISAKAKKMQEDGIKVINFTVGEPDFNTPEYIIDAAKKALDAGHTKYTASAGILQLRSAICLKLRRDNGLNFVPNQIVVANGAKQALANVILAIINPGDEVIIPAPYWITYPELVKLAGGVPIYIEGNADFKITAKQLGDAITPKTKAVIINSPNNPSGAVYTESELCAIAEVLQKSGQQICVISDEIYECLIYNKKLKHFSIAKVYPQTVVINGFSKTYSMTGWRIGYSASSPEIATAIDNVQSHMTSNVNTMTQYAALEALAGNEGEKFLQEMLAEFDRRRRYMVDRISKMPGVSCNTPDGAFYVMVKTNYTSEQFLEHARIATVPGEAFGAPGYIRFCYTVSMNDIVEGMNRLEQFLKIAK